MNRPATPLVYAACAILAGCSVVQAPVLAPTTWVVEDSEVPRDFRQFGGDFVRASEAFTRLGFSYEVTFWQTERGVSHVTLRTFAGNSVTLDHRIPQVTWLAMLETARQAQADFPIEKHSSYVSETNADPIPIVLCEHEATAEFRVNERTYRQATDCGFTPDQGHLFERVIKAGFLASGCTLPSRGSPADAIRACAASAG